MPVRLSVCRWRLCTVVTGCDGSRISLHALIDGCLCYLLTTPHPDCQMGWCRDFWWKRGGMEKLVIVVISLILLIFYQWTGNMWRCWVLTTQNIIIDSRKCIMSEDGTTNYHIGLERRHIVRILHNGRRIKRGIKCVMEKCVTYTLPCSVGYKMCNCVTAGN